MTDELKRDIRIYIHHGYSFMEVSERTGATFVEIHRALSEEREEFEMAKPLSSEKWTGIAEALRAGGKSQMAIAEEYNVGTGTVSRIAKAIKDEGKEKEPAAEATAQGSEQNISEDIIPENTADVKPSDENLSENPDEENEVSNIFREMDSIDRKMEIHALLKELVLNELSFLWTQIQNLQLDIDKCKYRQELLREYLGGDEIEP